MNKKYIVILGDGMADYPNKDGLTPLMMAKKPNIDYYAEHGILGLCATIPKGMKPGSDTANLSVMGYNPAKYYTGRSPLEAVSMGISLADDDVTYRCNLVSLSDDERYDDKTMVDYSSSEIKTADAKMLIDYLNEKLPLGKFKLYAGISYRHCLTNPHAHLGTNLTPPHDISDRKIGDYLPKDGYSDQLLSLMRQSYDLLSAHPFNIDRKAKGLHPANSMWVWGEGTKPMLDDFYAKTGLHGAMISAVDLLKGIAISAGMTSIDVPGATGNLDTNYVGKAQAAIDALKSHDYIYLHIEAPDECGHRGEESNKVKAIEMVDSVVGIIRKYLESSKIPFRMLITPDHATPIATKTHAIDPIPFVIFDSAKTFVSDTYNEATAKKQDLLVESGDALNSLFLI